MPRPRKHPNTSTRVLAYLRVSTDEQASSGLGLAAQRATLDAEVARRGWADVEWIADEGYSAKSLRRPGIAEVLDELGAGRAGVLVVAKLDRLSRSMVDFAGLLERARAEGWALLALDTPLDMTTPMGEAMASVVVTFAQLERRLIAQRTREALAIKRAAGRRICRPSVVDRDGLGARIVAMRQEGATYQAICDKLNAEGVPTLRGAAVWQPSSLAATLRRVEVAADVDEAEAVAS